MRQSNGLMKKNSFNPIMLQDEIIIGLLLSDAHLLKIKNQFQNSLFQISASTKHSEFIDFIEKYLNDLGFSTYKKTYVRELGEVVNLNTERHPFFTELRKIWYPNEKKIVPDSIKLTSKSIAWWFMGDGNSNWYKRGNNKVRISFATDGFDMNSVINLQQMLEEYNVSTYLRCVIGNCKPRLEAKKSEFVYRLMNMIKPHMLPCFYYKVKIPTLNTKTGPIPLWKRDKTRKKCSVNSCIKTAMKNKLNCHDHKALKFLPQINNVK